MFIDILLNLMKTMFVEFFSQKSALVLFRVIRNLSANLFYE